MGLDIVVWCNGCKIFFDYSCVLIIVVFGFFFYDCEMSKDYIFKYIICCLKKVKGLIKIINFNILFLSLYKYDIFCFIVSII